jgi:tetratricopeptide (TPR) repeat protein
MERLGLDNNARSYHAFAWLLYGHLQKGQVDAATDIMHKMVQYTNELPSKPARNYLHSMKGNYLVETGDWEGSFADIEVDINDLNIVTQAAWHFVEGMKVFQRQDKAGLEALIVALEDKRQAASLKISDRGTPLCSAGNTRNLPNRLDLDQARVMELELRALYARLLDNPEMAEQLMKEAADLESTLDYSYGPPDIVYPSFELYGEWLLEQGRAQEAMTQFDRSLERGPRRVKALRGKLSAARQLNDEKIVNDTEAILKGIKKEPLET